MTQTLLVRQMMLFSSILSDYKIIQPQISENFLKRQWMIVSLQEAEPKTQNNYRIYHTQYYIMTNNNNSCYFNLEKDAKFL